MTTSVGTSSTFTRTTLMGRFASWSMAALLLAFSPAADAVAPQDTPDDSSLNAPKSEFNDDLPDEVGPDEVTNILHESVSSKNWYFHRGGFSPYQFVLG